MRLEGEGTSIVQRNLLPPSSGQQFKSTFKKETTSSSKYLYLHSNELYDILLKIFNKIKSEKNFLGWKIVIIEPTLKERGTRVEPKKLQRNLTFVDMWHEIAWYLH
jgi:hypothetical protein